MSHAIGIRVGFTITITESILEEHVSFRMVRLAEEGNVTDEIMLSSTIITVVIRPQHININRKRRINVRGERER